MSRDLARKIRLNEDEAAAKLPKMNPVMVQWRLRRPAFDQLLDSTLDLQVIELVCVIHRQETLPRSNLNRTHDAKRSYEAVVTHDTPNQHKISSSAFQTPRRRISAKRSSSRINADVLRPDLGTAGWLRKWTKRPSALVDLSMCGLLLKSNTKRIFPLEPTHVPLEEK